MDKESRGLKAKNGRVGTPSLVIHPQLDGTEAEIYI